MATNLRFSTAIEALALMAAKPEGTHTSQTLADALTTNPVVIRRLLAELSKAEIVATAKGPSGGSKLARGAKQISLRDIYRALGADELLHQTEHGAESTQELRRAIHSVFRKAQKSLEEELDSVTLQQVIKKAEKRQGAKKAKKEAEKKRSAKAKEPEAAPEVAPPSA
jgi:Rrf2 family protein